MAASRAKRPLKVEETPGKKSKRRHPSCSDDEDSKGHWSLKALGNDFPSSSIYNTTSRSQPAELFRKDLISAMKLPDSEPLSPEDYWLITDQWKQEWEKGVQVPVNPDAAPDSVVKTVRKRGKTKDFKLPKNYIRTTHDEFFSNDLHQLSNAPAQAEQMCRYDLDNCDVQWLKALNVERVEIGLPPVDELTMEQVIEELETQCYDNIQHAIQNEAGLGIEYDEDVICDVCRSPDSEEGNEMVFCDSCDICVHQACYGITSIPQGSWMCRTCVLAIKPSCLLCPNKGGAMKSTRSGQKWAHVSCSLWIPEVSIGCVDKMEPITKISHIPTSRWALVCCICRDRVGACIQCSVKTCKTAYHVTCAFQDGLQMKAIVEDENDEDGVKLRSYCPKHSKSRDGERSSDSESDEVVKKHKKKKRKCNPKNEATLEENANARAQRLQQIESDFFNLVSLSDIVESLSLDSEVVDFIFTYWKLKRAAGFNKPLITPKAEETDLLGREQEDSLYARMRMFVHLRQDLERVRNLCYMVNRREKLSRSWCRLREQIFHKQVALLTDGNNSLSEPEKQKLMHATHGNSVYDQLYSYDITCCVKRKGKPHADGSPQKCLNGLVKGTPKTPRTAEKQPNPYAKTYFNGRSQRRSAGTPGSSGELNMSSSSDRLELHLSSSTDRIEEKVLSECEQGSDAHPCTDVEAEDATPVERRREVGSLDNSLRVPGKCKFSTSGNRRPKSDDSSTLRRSGSNSSLEEETISVKKDDPARTSRDKSPASASHKRREKQTEEKTSKRGSTSERQSSSSLSLSSKKRTKSQDEATTSSRSSSKNKDKRLKRLENSSVDKSISRSKSGNDSLSQSSSSCLDLKGDSKLLDSSSEKHDKCTDKSGSRSERKSSSSSRDKKNSVSTREKKNSSGIREGKSSSQVRERKSSSSSSAHERSRSTSTSGCERSVGSNRERKSSSNGRERQSSSSGKTKEKSGSSGRKSKNSSTSLDGKSNNSLHEEKNSHGLREGKSGSRLREGKHNCNVGEKPKLCDKKSSSSEKRDKLEKSRFRNKASSSAGSCLRSDDHLSNKTEKTSFANDIISTKESSPVKSDCLLSPERKTRLPDNSVSVHKTKEQHKLLSNVNSVKNVNLSKKIHCDAGMNPGVVITKLTDIEVDRSIKRNHSSVEDKQSVVGKRKSKCTSTDKVPESLNNIFKSETKADTGLKKSSATKQLIKDDEKERRKEKRKRLEESRGKISKEKSEALKDHCDVSKEDKRAMSVSDKRKPAKGKTRDSLRGEKREACRAEKHEPAKIEKLEALRPDKREVTRAEKREATKSEKREASSNAKHLAEGKRNASRSEKRDASVEEKRRVSRVDKHNAAKEDKSSKEEKRESSLKDHRKTSKEERRKSSRDIKSENTKEVNAMISREERTKDLKEVRFGLKNDSKKLKREKQHETIVKHQALKERKGDPLRKSECDSLKDGKNVISKESQCSFPKEIKKISSKDKVSKEKYQVFKEGQQKLCKNSSKERNCEVFNDCHEVSNESQSDASDNDEVLSVDESVVSSECVQTTSKRKRKVLRINISDSSDDAVECPSDVEELDIGKDHFKLFEKNCGVLEDKKHKMVDEVIPKVFQKDHKESVLNKPDLLRSDISDMWKNDDSDASEGRVSEITSSESDTPEMSKAEEVKTSRNEKCEDKKYISENCDTECGKEETLQPSDKIKFDILKDCEEISDDELVVSNEDELDFTNADELDFSNDGITFPQDCQETCKNNGLEDISKDGESECELIDLEGEINVQRYNEQRSSKEGYSVGFRGLQVLKESEPGALTEDGTKTSVGIKPNASTDDKPQILTEEEQSVTVDDERRASFEDQRSVSFEERKVTSPEDEQRISVDEPEASTEDEQQASTEDEQQASTEDEQQASTEDEQQASTEDEQQASTEDEQRASAEDEQRASAEDEQRASAEDEQRASAEDEKRASTEDEKRASAEDEKRALAEDEKRALTEDEKRALTEDEKRALTEDEKRALTEDELRALTEDELQASTEDEQQASTEDEQQASTEDEQQASTEDEQQASTEDEQQASTEDEQQASTEDEQQASTEDEQQASTEDERSALVQDESVAWDGNVLGAPIGNEPGALSVGEPTTAVGDKLKDSVEANLGTLLDKVLDVSSEIRPETLLGDEPTVLLEDEPQTLNEFEPETSVHSETGASVADEADASMESEQYVSVLEKEPEMFNVGHEGTSSDGELKLSKETTLGGTNEDVGVLNADRPEQVKAVSENNTEVIRKELEILNESNSIWAKVIPENLNEDKPEVFNEEKQVLKAQASGTDHRSSKEEKRARRESRRRECRLQRQKLVQKDRGVGEEPRSLRSRCTSLSDVINTYHVERCATPNEIKIIVRPPPPVCDREDKASDINTNKPCLETASNRIVTRQHFTLECSASRSEVRRKTSKRDRKKEKEFNDGKEQKNLRDASCERWKWRLRESHARNQTDVVHNQQSPNSESRSPVSSPPATPKVDHSSDQYSTSSVSPKRDRTPTQDSMSVASSKTLECLFPSPSSKVSCRLSSYRILKKSRSESDEGEKEAPPSPLPIPTVVIPLVDLEEEEKSLRLNADNNRLANGESVNDVVFSSPSLPPPASPPPFSPSSSSPPPTPTIAETSPSSSPTLAKIILPAPIVVPAPSTSPSPQLSSPLPFPPPQNPPPHLPKPLVANPPPTSKRKIHQVQIIHPENNRSPRLIIKLRKDPNYPESPRWRRDSDYDSEVISVPPPINCDADTVKKPIRLRLPARLYTTPLPPPERNHRRRKQKRSSEPSSKKYSMRSRSAQQDSSSKYGHTEPS